MKLVCLNMWGAARGDLFYDYIEGLAASTDIFCFQEVYSAGPDAPEVFGPSSPKNLQRLSKLLHDFSPYYEMKSSGYADDGPDKVTWEVSHGIVIFVKKFLLVKDYRAQTIGDSVGSGAPPVEGLVKVQALTLQIGTLQFLVLNTHGMSQPGTKLDTDIRLQQSKKLLEFLATLPKLPTIICGDFNLMPDTQSIIMIENKGFKNLIKSFDIKNTRNKISWQQYDNIQYFADYTFVSPEVMVKSFEVPYNEVSDHLPMILEFSI